MLGAFFFVYSYFSGKLVLLLHQEKPTGSDAEKKQCIVFVCFFSSFGSYLNCARLIHHFVYISNIWMFSMIVRSYLPVTVRDEPEYTRLEMRGLYTSVVCVCVHARELIMRSKFKNKIQTNDKILLDDSKNV